VNANLKEHENTAWNPKFPILYKLSFYWFLPLEKEEKNGGDTQEKKLFKDKLQYLQDLLRISFKDKFMHKESSINKLILTVYSVYMWEKRPQPIQKQMQYRAWLIIL
jgi:hypothetical protein